MRFKRELGLIAALGLVWSSAHAQDQTTEPAKEEPKQETPKPETPKEEEAAPAPKRPLLITYDLGAESWRLGGNDRKFRQYATPPSGLNINQLRIEPWNIGGAAYGVIDLRSPFATDYLIYGKASFFYGNTYVSAYDRRSEFFNPTPVAVDESDRSVTEVSAKQMVGRKASLSYQYRGDRLNYVKPPSYFDIHQRTFMNNVSLEGEVFRGFGSLSYTDFRYFDRTDLQPDMQAKVAMASFGKEIVPGFSLEGAVSRTEAEPDGGDRNRVDTASIGGGIQLGPVSDLTVALSREWWDLPTVESAKLHQRDLTRVNLTTRLIPGWTAQLGMKSVQIERERFDHSWIDAPRWNTYEAKLYGRLLKQVRVSLRGFTQSVKGFALSTINGETEPLYWTNRSGASARLETGNEIWNAYGALSYNTNRNSDRDTEVRYRNVTIGGTWQVHPSVALYAEHSSDQSVGRSGTVEGPDFDSFFPDGRTDVVGLSWAVNPTTFAMLDYTDLVTDNDNPFLDPQGNYRGQYLTTTLRFQTKNGVAFDLTFAPWRYDDRVYDSWGYNATVFGLSARGRF